MKHLEQHYRDNFTSLRRRYKKMLGPNTEDCIQEAYTKALTYGKDFKERKTFDKYFSLVMRSVIIDFKKEQKSGGVHRESYVTIARNLTALSPEDILLIKEETEDLESLISAKQGMYRIILELAFLFQLSVEDIERTLPTSYSYITTAINRFRNELRNR